LKIAQVRRVAMSLPEVEGKPHFDFWSFRVAGKIFATVPPDEEHLHAFVGEEERERWIAADSTAFQPLPWGAKIVGLRVVLSKAKPSAVEEILRTAWRSKAPKRLFHSKTG
jgi:hypothetical protein